ncbi:alkaline phosphatase family protein [Phytohabitans rumicis]|uniref:Alkaline phosphatase family protein n=1 Tax=Phytohabitans rumicis TaxID=1076125 RepID=A0A6V8KU68_9ACTN|nr:nucleotide pyrophosphatase/phosphodiesterase family protein [Phytohabitans rumicis]GFJ88633.1 alkaline phosphatase family protein [Phytohabitans rumicis]
MTAPFDVVRPAYGTGSLAEVMPSVLATLGVPGAPDPLGLAARLDGVRRVAVLLVDGLGAYQIPLAAPHAPTLADVARGATDLTCGFPSTTPAGLASLGTGAVPGAHGLLAFTVNVPGTDRVLNHGEWWDDPDPVHWQPVPTQLEAARAAGVVATMVSRPEFAGSGMTKAAWRGGAYRGAADADALATEMLAALRAGPGLVGGYHPDVDKAGHIYGLDSPQWRAAVSEVDTLIARLVAGLPADAALLVTADHGQLDVPLDRRWDIDTDPRLSAGVRVVAGEPRVRYLHTLPGARDDVLAAWRAVLGDTSWVVPREEAVAAGWFGPVREEHLARIGDVVVACHAPVAVLATAHEPPSVANLIAYHGSYTAVEMTVPLIVVRGG